MASTSSSSSRSTSDIRRTQGTGTRNQVAQLSPNWPNTPRGTAGRSDLAKKLPASAEIRKMFAPPGAAAGPAPVVNVKDIKPLMSYTRIFHGLDPELQKSLQAYVIYSGDLRSGGWEAYLQRSEDFLKFTAHQMIVEMLALHGGTLKTESVFTHWK